MPDGYIHEGLLLLQAGIRGDSLPGQYLLARVSEDGTLVARPPVPAQHGQVGDKAPQVPARARRSGAEDARERPEVPPLRQGDAGRHGHEEVLLPDLPEGRAMEAQAGDAAARPRRDRVDG